MAASHFAGPLNTYGNGGPSPLWGGAALFDPRVGYLKGAANTTAVYSWHSQEYMLVDQAPSTISAVNIAAAAVPVSGTAMTLVAATGAGITVGVAITNQATGQFVTVLAIDGAATPIVYNASSPIVTYDPRNSISRNVRITSVGNDSTGTFTVRGYDIYGYPMTETITGANATVVSGKKAFKYIASVTPGGTMSGSNASVGTGDVYGFPLRTDEFALTRLSWNAIIPTATTGYLAADTTTATATTGDVRGTYAIQTTASDGTRKLIMYETIPAWNLAPVNNVYSGLFGVAQF